MGTPTASGSTPLRRAPFRPRARPKSACAPAAASRTPPTSTPMRRISAAWRSCRTSPASSWPTAASGSPAETIAARRRRLPRLGLGGLLHPARHALRRRLGRPCARAHQGAERTRTAPAAARVMTQVSPPRCHADPASPLAGGRRRSPHDPARERAPRSSAAPTSSPAVALDAARFRPEEKNSRQACRPSRQAEYYIAAVREMLRGSRRRAALRQETGPKISSARRAALLINRRQQPFLEILEKEDLYIPAGELVYYANWITAPGTLAAFRRAALLRRGGAPEGQEGSHDAAENGAAPLDQARREAARRAASAARSSLVFATQPHAGANLMTFQDPESRFAAVYACALPSRPTAPAGRRAKEGAKLFSPRRSAVFRDPLERSRGNRPEQLRTSWLPGLPKRLDRLGHAPHRAQPPE